MVRFLNHFLVIGLTTGLLLKAHSRASQLPSKRTYERRHTSMINCGAACKDTSKRKDGVRQEPITVTDSLVLTEIAESELEYELETAGMNGHSCSSSGRAFKTANGFYIHKVANELDPKQTCEFKFDLKDSRSVSIYVSGKGCRSLCGLRHSFAPVEVFKE